MNLKKTLRIFLTAAILSSCAAKPLNLPFKKPEGPYYQTIIDQEFCDKNGNCVRKSVCKEYNLNKKHEFEFIKSHDIKMCHGIIGVKSDFYQQIREWLRKTYLWMQENCEFTNNK